MKDIGRITRLMEEDVLSIPMEMFIKESGKMIKPMVKESIITMMAPVIMESGMKMYSKASESKNGPMDHPMKGNFFSI